MVRRSYTKRELLDSNPKKRAPNKWLFIPPSWGTKAFEYIPGPTRKKLNALFKRVSQQVKNKFICGNPVHKGTLTG